jgi:hypothetical protein
VWSRGGRVAAFVVAARRKQQHRAVTRCTGHVRECHRSDAFRLQSADWRLYCVPAGQILNFQVTCSLFQCVCQSKQRGNDANHAGQCIHRLFVCAKRGAGQWLAGWARNSGRRPSSHKYVAVASAVWTTAFSGPRCGASETSEQRSRRARCACGRGSHTRRLPRMRRLVFVTSLTGQILDFPVTCWLF